MLNLSTIKPAKGSTRGKKRVGRGNASGHGTYSTRGMKGQRARSGVTNLKRLGLRSQLLATPKKRGFRSAKPKAQVVNIFSINKLYKDNEIVSPKTLFAKGLITDVKGSVKILGKDALKNKSLKFEGVAMSEGVKNNIVK